MNRPLPHARPARLIVLAVLLVAALWAIRGATGAPSPAGTVAPTPLPVAVQAAPSMPAAPVERAVIAAAELPLPAPRPVPTPAGDGLAMPAASQGVDLPAVPPAGPAIGLLGLAAGVALLAAGAARRQAQLALRARPC